MEYEKSYAFQPEDSRPLKKRRTELTGPRGLQASWPTRRKAYQEAWKLQQDKLSETLNRIHHTACLDVLQFLHDTASSRSDRIPTAILLAGPGAATSQNSLILQIQENVLEHESRVCVILESSSASNLKSVLKLLIQRGTSALDIDDEDDDVSGPSRNGPRLLNYDLQRLHDDVRDRKREQVIVCFPDTEAFSDHVLSELIELLGSWRDRIPFVCLFGVATSVESLQQRLSRKAVQCLEGRLFDATPSEKDLQKAFLAIVQRGASLWIGPVLLHMALERESDYIQSMDSFVDMVRYAYMSCYYANALSIFLDRNIQYNVVPGDHFQALRNLDSFRIHAKNLLEEGKAVYVRDLLESDKELFELVKDKCKTGRRKLEDLIKTWAVIQAIQNNLHLPNTQALALTDFYIMAIRGKLRDGVFLRMLLLSIRKSPVPVVTKIMSEAIPYMEVDYDTHRHCEGLQQELLVLIQNHEQQGKTQPLRSEEDVGSSTLRTTVVAQKVHLSKQKSELSKEDAAYTDILRRFTVFVEAFFSMQLIDPADLPFHEIFIYDLKTPHRDVFTPRPRHAIERALATPHDYLDCECCAPKQGEGDEGTLSATQPATAVLYQLYLESGSLINVSDLWQAFLAVMGDEADEERTMALFQRALAELRFLGMVKSTRKRADHVAKVAWKGL